MTAVVGRPHGLKVPQIVSVHRENIVEPVEIHGRKLPCAKMSDIVPAPGGRFNPAEIWWVTNMPITRAARIHQHRRCKSQPIDLCLKDTLRAR